MPRTARKQSASSLYHVMNRGVGKQIVFEDDADRAFFLSKMDRLLVEHRATLIAWCLMDNHFHLFLEIPHEELSAFMHRLQTTYAGYFNRVHDHTGALFGSRFRSEAVETDEYLMQLVRYIHENPVKGHITRSLDYKWSSFREYKDKPRRVDTSLALGVFGGWRQMIAFHNVAHEEDSCMDYDTSPDSRLSDIHALEVAESVLGKDGVLTVGGMCREERNAALVRLRESGLGIRQIQRLTGVSKSVVSRVTAGCGIS